MHILIAPNAFKNSLDAGKAAEAISKGLKESKLQCTTESFPVADGGDGTAALLIEHLEGEYTQVMVHDPLGRKITSSFGLIENGQTAIIELADASGLRLLTPAEYNPLHATTFGTGELMLEAISKNVRKIILCIGGSATVDGGTGILRALGIKFFDADGKELEAPSSFQTLADILINIPKSVQNTEIIVLCDVENTLLGARGAASVFGPQKGADPNDVLLLETCLTRLREVVFRKTASDMAAVVHGGASGGVAAGLHTLLNARLVNGIDHFLKLTKFSRKLQKAELVITGEGSIDSQTLHGKGPFGVAKMAKEFSVPVIGLAGKITTDSELSNYFSELISINEENADLEDAIQNTYNNLVRAATMLGDKLNGKK